MLSKAAYTVGLIAILISAAPAVAADQKMTGAELTALLSQGKTINMGAPGAVTGQLTINKDGTASGQGKAGATSFTIAGVWKIQGDQFCRTWKGGRDSGKQVCETWITTAPNTVKVMAKGKQIGINSW